VGSAASALTIVAGVLWQAIVVIPVGAILLTAFTGYLFQRQIQKDSQKYEIRRLAVNEALGPVYVQVHQILGSVRSAPSRVSLNMQTDFGATWTSIRESHKFFLIQEPLQSKIGDFFAGYSKFQNDISNCRASLDSIEQEAWSGIGDGIGMNGGLSYILKNDTEEFRGSIQDAIFWKKDPSVTSGLVWFRLYGQGTNPVTLTQLPISYEKAEAKKIAEAVLSKAWPKSDDDERIRQTRRENQTN